MKKILLSAVISLSASVFAQAPANPANVPAAGTPAPVQEIAPVEEIAMDPVEPAATEAVAQPVAADEAPSLDALVSDGAEGSAPAPIEEISEPVASTPQDPLVVQDVEAGWNETVAAQPVADTDQSALAPAPQQATPVATPVAAPVQPTPKVQPEPENSMVVTAVSPVVVETPAETVAPVEKAPSKSALDDILHGNAYNPVSNEAAAATVGSEMEIPHKMHARNFAYFEPINEEGVISFGQNLTWFFAFNNHSNLGLVTAGLAANSFGFSLQAAVGKRWNFVDNDQTGEEETIRGTDAGTAVGGALSFRIAGLDLAVKMAFDHPESENSVKGGEQESEDDIWNLGGKLVVARSGEMLSWSAGLGVARFNSKSRVTAKSIFNQNGRNYIATTTTSKTDSSARVEVIPEFNVAGSVLRREKARVYLGMNLAVPLIAYDRIKDVCSRNNEYAMTATPNILGEVMLGSHVVAFGSASHQWDIFRYKDSYINEVSTKTMDISSGVTTTSVGMRFEYEMAAVEMALTKQFMKNPFGAFSTTDEMFTSIGLFINF